MIPTFTNIHLKFRLNGNYFDREDLKEVAYSFVKEGQPYEKEIGDFLMDWLDDKPFVDVCTSGSTGKPKLIRLDKQAMVHSALATGDFFGISAGNSALHCLPSSFIAGKMMLVRAIILGLALDIVVPSMNPLASNDTYYDFCAMVPIQVEHSLQQLHHIKTLIVGGAPASSTLIDTLQHKSTNVFATYGMTETITHIAAKPLNNVSKTITESYFATLPNITVRKDERDCLVIHAPRICNEEIITNDVVEIISETKFNWLGRFDNVINSGGIKLHPEQIEEKLSTFISGRYFVSGIKDAQFGEKLILIIEDEKNELNTSKIIEKIQQSNIFSKFEIPKEVFVLEKFVDTNTGKVQRSKTLALLRL